MNPESAPMPMLMKNWGGWNNMFMGTAFLNDTQQSGPRGADKLYSPNWFMYMLEHKLGGGSFLFETMLSLEPLTVTDRRYPLLFQTGETAYGQPIVDGQHPHNFVMSLGVHYAHSIGESTILEFFAAPVGDPALGPVAFPHRDSAREFPQAPIGHHWQDSTHIAYDVLTAGHQVSLAAPRSQRIPRSRAWRESLDHRLWRDRFLVHPVVRVSCPELDGPSLRWSSHSS